MERLYDDEIDHMIFVLKGSKCRAGIEGIEDGWGLSECGAIIRKLEAMQAANDTYEKHLSQEKHKAQQHSSN